MTPVLIQLLRSNRGKKRNKFFFACLMTVICLTMPVVPCAHAQKESLLLEFEAGETHVGGTLDVFASGGGTDSNLAEGGDSDPYFSFFLAGGVTAVVHDPHAVAFGRHWDVAWNHGWNGDTGRSEVWHALDDIFAEGHEELGSFARTSSQYYDYAYSEWQIGVPPSSEETWIEGLMEITGGDIEFQLGSSSYNVMVSGVINIGDSSIYYWFEDGGIWVAGILKDLEDSEVIWPPEFFDEAYVQFAVREYVDPEEIISIGSNMEGEYVVAAGAGFEYDYAGLVGSVGGSAEMTAYYGVPD